MLKFIFAIIHYYIIISKGEYSRQFTVCHNEMLSLLGTNKNVAKVIDMLPGSHINLKCRFCKDSANDEEKIWYYKKRGNIAQWKTILRDKYYDNPKVTIAGDYTLQLKKFNINDSGIYLCKSMNEAENYIKFPFILEGILREKKQITHTGTTEQWQQYKQDLLNPVNRMFELSDDEPFKTFRKTFKFSFRLLTTWENWGPCVINTDGVNVRTRMGRCRLHPIPNKNKITSRVNKHVEELNQFYLSENYDVSCYSTELRNNLPNISKIVSKIPEYQAITEIINNSVIYLGVLNETQVKQNDFVYTVTKHIPENGHITLICPDITFESNVEWYKDSVILNSSLRNNMAESEQEPHLTIDSYNSLYVLQATKNEEGSYICIVDGKKIQKYYLKIVSKSKLLNAEIVRYSIYLGFVLLLSLICYCTGVYVAWRKRSSFADPLNLNNKNI